MTELTQFYPVGFDKRKLLELMRVQALNGILLTSPENVFYTTGYTALPSSGNPILYTLRSRLPFFSYIDDDGQVTLLCWGFSAEGVDFGVDNLIGFSNFLGAREALDSLLRQKLRSKSTLGIESSCPYYVLTLLDETVQPESLHVVDDIMSGLRLIKSDQEIELIKKSTEIIEQTVAELYEILRPGMGRSELIREAKYRMIRNGATGLSHTTFSFAQANPEIDIDEKLGPNRLVTLDLGGIYQGYASDNRRYAYSGSIPASLLERYTIMVEMVDKVGAALLPGTSYADLFQLTLDLYARYKIKPLARFNHTGHNIGLETEEEWLDDSADKKIQAGMAINIELYSTAETGEQIGDEETYIIGESGPTRISVLPREMRVIE
jgi:Xaa-Pro aminopeptidase